MAYAYTNGKGNTYYLHSKLLRDKQDPTPTDYLYFFAKTVRDNALDEIPVGYVLSETKNGLPVLKRKR
ncbi:MAG: hypothetical protein MUQ10_09185 [Anaerolineae bacterium]|nr:hypothetical protein [Anaerolineae bacterium]